MGQLADLLRDTYNDTDTRMTDLQRNVSHCRTEEELVKSLRGHHHTVKSILGDYLTLHSLMESTEEADADGILPEEICDDLFEKADGTAYSMTIGRGGLWQGEPLSLILKPIYDWLDTRLCLRRNDLDDDEENPSRPNYLRHPGRAADGPPERKEMQSSRASLPQGHTHTHTN